MHDPQHPGKGTMNAIKTRQIAIGNPCVFTIHNETLIDLNCHFYRAMAGSFEEKAAI